MKVGIIERRDNNCELCGKVEELRPYGPNGELICFECGMKDEETTTAQFAKLSDADVTILETRSRFERLANGESILDQAATGKER